MLKKNRVHLEYTVSSEVGQRLALQIIMKVTIITDVL